MRGRCPAVFRNGSNWQLYLWGMNLLCGLRWFWLLPFLLGPKVQRMCTRWHEGGTAIPLQNQVDPSTLSRSWPRPIHFSNSFIACTQSFVPWSVSSLAFYIFWDALLVLSDWDSSVWLVLMCKLNADIEDFSLPTFFQYCEDLICSFTIVF